MSIASKMTFLKKIKTQRAVSAVTGSCGDRGSIVTRHPIVLMILLLGVIAFPITGYPQISLSTSDLRITDVTPTAFSVVWISNQPASCSASVYFDPEGNYPIGGLTIIDESAEHPPAGQNGVMKVRVSALIPDTTYFFRIVTVSDKGVLVEPASGLLPSVKTEMSSGVVSNDVLLHRILKSDGVNYALGALLVVEVQGADYPVTGWVGDHFPAPWAGAELANLYSATNHRSLQLYGGEAITVESIGGFLGFRSLRATLPEVIGGALQRLKPEPKDEECTLLIYLPATWEYGMISGEPSQINGVSFYFEGVSGNVILSYEPYDVDDVTEVEILINGESVGFAPITGDNSWGGVKTILLPDAHVNNASANVITFKNTYNPVTNERWGVRNLSYRLPPNALNVTALPVSPQAPGTLVTFSAAGSGGTGPYEYQFWWRSDTGSWAVVRDWSQDATWGWDTTGVALGTYYVQVFARNVGSSATYEAAAEMGYDLKRKPVRPKGLRISNLDI